MAGAKGRFAASSAWHAAAALVRVGEVEKREAHSPLDLQRPIPHEKHRGRVRVDALDRQPAISGGIGEQGKDRLL
jgi:hypothetical protein